MDTKAQAEQVRSVPVERIGAVIARLPNHRMAQLDDALRPHLSNWVAPEAACALWRSMGAAQSSGRNYPPCFMLTATLVVPSLRNS